MKLKCWKCGVRKEESEFYPSRLKQSNYICKACNNKETYKRRKDGYLRKTRNKS